MAFLDSIKFVINKEDVENLKQDAVGHFPKEVCGLITAEYVNKMKIKLSFYFVENKSKTNSGFLIPILEIEQLNRKLSGKNVWICGVFHSHPYGNAKPSYADILNGAKTRFKIWAIYSIRCKDLGLFHMGNLNRQLKYEILT